jgi:hypothetical protein
MTVDLTPYFDAVNTTEAEVQRIAGELDALFRLGTDEDKAKALERMPELKTAELKHEEAIEAYGLMQMTNRPNDIAKNFVPVSNTQPEPAEGSQPTVITRQEYNQMTQIDRARFIKSGGRLKD